MISSGNSYSNLSVQGPAFAYNAIVVGNLDDKNTVNTADDEIESGSCYEESSGTNRPDLVAPGTDITFGVLSDSGTSFAAPYVTATIAQLC